MANTKKSATIIIPTYNEAENIAAITEEILKNLPDGKIIIVDDDSRDNTEKIALSLVQKDNRIKFISRRGKARSFAQSYIDGFRTAIADKADNIIQMDADFSHDPKVLPVMIENLENYDVVIGSRYTKGGKVENWPLIRRLISRGGGIYSQIITGVPINDMTAGFVGWRREALEKIELDKIRSNGYGFQIEMKFNAHKNHFRIKEIPITFTDRQLGASKMRKMIIVEAALYCIKLRFSK
jgi:dolichol-phosphate mannosyltransferase